MYRCENCGVIFEEPSKYTECMGEFWGSPAYDTFYVCPNCGDDYIDEYSGEEEDDED